MSPTHTSVTNERGAQQQVERLDKQIDGYRSERHELLPDAERNIQRIAALESLTGDTQVERQRLATELTIERRRSNWIGLPLYLAFGALLAAALATDVLQAVAIGFGWTAVMDRVGLTRDEPEKALARQVVVEDLEKAEQLGEENRRLRQQTAELTGLLEWQKAVADAFADEVNELRADTGRQVT